MAAAFIPLLSRLAGMGLFSRNTFGLPTFVPIMAAWKTFCDQDACTVLKETSGISGGLARIPDNTGGGRKILLFTVVNG